jgi:hypothetical protein
MLLTFRKVELVLLDTFVIAVTVLSIGLATITMLMASALIATLAILARLKCSKQKRTKNECIRTPSRWKPLQR